MKITVDQVRNDYVAVESYDYRERLGKAWWSFDSENKVWRTDSFRKVVPFLSYIDGAARRKFCADAGPPDPERVRWARRDIRAMAAVSTDDCKYRNSRGFSASNNGPGKRLAGKDAWDMVDYLRAERILRDHKGQVEGMREARNAAIQKNIESKTARMPTDHAQPQPSPGSAQAQPSLPGLPQATPGPVGSKHMQPSRPGQPVFRNTGGPGTRSRRK